MNNKEKMVNEKPYGATNLLKDFIILEGIILYVVLVIGDMVSGFSELGKLLTRYIPIGLATLVSTFLIVKSKAKKCKKSEEKEVKKFIFIAPVIIAVIIVAYGFYSVEVNLKDVDLGTLELLYSDEYLDMLVQAARDMARQIWVITGVTYLVTAEVMVFIASKKLKYWLKDDFQEVPTMMNQNEFIGNQEPFVNPITPQENTSTLNNIKWDL